MIEREKVIKELSWIVFNFPLQENPKDEADRMCNAVNIYCNNALALLKVEKPQVLLEEEVRERLGTFLWVELHSPKTDRPLCLVFGRMCEDALYPHFVTIREDSGTAWGRRWEDYGAGCWQGIRSGWRCWSARPSDEQRKAVKWDE